MNATKIGMVGGAIIAGSLASFGAYTVGRFAQHYPTATYDIPGPRWGLGTMVVGGVGGGFSGALAAIATSGVKAFSPKAAAYLGAAQIGGVVGGFFLGRFHGNRAEKQDCADLYGKDSYLCT